MKQLIFSFMLLASTISFANSNQTLLNTVVFTEQAEAEELLTTDDEFTKSWSQFDIDSRLRKSNGSKEELLTLISHQVKEWTSEEIVRIKGILKVVDSKISEQGFNLNLPGSIKLIKTSGEEEGGASGYTRTDYIVLKNNIMQMPTNNLTHLLVHELFHVLSRNNPEFRTKIYALIGFKMMPPIKYPSTIEAYRITNPDATQTDCYTTVIIDNDTVNCMMVLYSKKEYTSGPFFEYLSVGFLVLEGEEEKTPVIKGGQPEIYEFKDVSNFFEQVGENTQYIIHPEEILAENFAMTILGSPNLKSPKIIDSIKELLQSQ